MSLMTDEPKKQRMYLLSLLHSSQIYRKIALILLEKLGAAACSSATS